MTTEAALREALAKWPCDACDGYAHVGIRRTPCTTCEATGIHPIARQALSAQPEVEQWQPIEPADGVERCLLWCADLADYEDQGPEPRGTVFGRIKNGKPKGEGMSGDWTFTHWRPLPAPPIQAMSDAWCEVEGTQTVATTPDGKSWFYSGSYWYEPGDRTAIQGDAS